MIIGPLVKRSITYSKRYQFSALFGISSEEDTGAGYTPKADERPWFNGEELNKLKAGIKANKPVQSMKDWIKEYRVNKKMKDIVDPNKLTTCVICLSKFKDNDDIRLLKCKHNFHTECIDKWLKDYNYKCPICREETGKGYPVL